jgi:hypothetical protein
LFRRFGADGIRAALDMEWGNLVFVGLVIGQIVPGTGPFRLSMVFAGLVSIVVSYMVAYYLMKGGCIKLLELLLMIFGALLFLSVFAYLIARGAKKVER